MSKEANARYDAKSTKHYGVKLNCNTDADIIAALDAAPNKQALIKTALRQHLSRISYTAGGTMTANMKGDVNERQR